jgi:CubicO group peptidase (beta-lactamase class C family)
MRGLLCGLVAAVVVAGCGGDEQRTAPDRLPQQLDAELAKCAGELDVPGAAAALYRRGELVWSGAWGKADIEEDRAMTAQTPVAYASVGKMITAALALRLAEQGRLSLDDPVRKWVPEWPGKRTKTLRGTTAGSRTRRSGSTSRRSAGRRGGSGPRTGSPPSGLHGRRTRTSTTTPASS